MRIELNITNSEKEIENAILSSIKDAVQDIFKLSIPSIKKSISTRVYNALTSEPEYQSLVSGKLQYEFGIPSSAQKVNHIIHIWSDNIVIETIPVKLAGSSIVGGFSLGMINSDYSDVLSDDSATVVDSKTGSILPWLEWLLLYGNRIIVSNYEVKVGPSPYSRTGLAIMKPSKKDWRVPAEFAGTKENNWVTRALNRLDEEIPNIIKQEIEKNI
jgi:hypothetical protein